jgi:hypothetical protein
MTLTDGSELSAVHIDRFKAHPDQDEREHEHERELERDLSSRRT